MRCSYVVLMRWMVIYEYETTKLPRPLVTMGILPFKKKIPMVDLGIEPVTS
jgi:hypothetical protein